MTISREDLLLLLEDGPQPIGPLSVWLKASPARVTVELQRLAKHGVVHQLGADRRWALISIPPAVTAAPPPDRSPARDARASTRVRPHHRARPTPADPPDDEIEHELELDAGEPIEDNEAITEDPDADIVDELLQPVQREGRGRPRRTLRQPHERPGRISLQDVAPSWWVGLSREQFSQESQQRKTGMSASREARMVGPGRRLD